MFWCGVGCGSILKAPASRLRVGGVTCSNCRLSDWVGFLGLELPAFVPFRSRKYRLSRLRGGVTCTECRLKLENSGFSTESGGGVIRSSYRLSDWVGMPRNIITGFCTLWWQKNRLSDSDRIDSCALSVKRTGF